MKPLISIIVPCYNQAQYLDECLQSVIEQTYKNWECIIVNDGSPDNTDEIANNWLKKDNRFKYLSKGNGGLSSARNAGIKIANGEIILPLDADDKILPEYTSSAVSVLLDNDDVKVVYCNAKKFGMQNELWHLPKFSRKILALQNPIFCSSFFRVRDWEVAGGYDEKMTHGLEDWEFWIAILKNGGKVHKLDTVGFLYRVKEISMITSLMGEQKKEVIDYICSKHPDFFIQYLGNPIEMYNKKKELENFHRNVTSSFIYKSYKSFKNKFAFKFFKNS